MKDLKIYLFKQGEMVLLKINDHNYCYSNVDNNNFSNTLCQWLKLNKFSEKQIQYILDEWNNRSIEDILSEFFNVKVIWTNYYEHYGQKCEWYENKKTDGSKKLDELYKKWCDKASKYYQRKDTSIKVAK